jgi:hypothetical protein
MLLPVGFPFQKLEKSNKHANIKKSTMFAPLLGYYFGGSILKSLVLGPVTRTDVFMVSFQPCSKKWAGTRNTNRMSENYTYILVMIFKQETDVGDLRVDVNMILKRI